MFVVHNRLVGISRVIAGEYIISTFSAGSEVILFFSSVFFFPKKARTYVIVN